MMYGGRLAVNFVQRSLERKVREETEDRTLGGKFWPCGGRTAMKACELETEEAYVGAAKLAQVHICQHRVFNAGIKIKTSQMFSKPGCGGYFSGLFLTLKTLFARAYTTPVRRDLDCFMRWCGSRV